MKSKLLKMMIALSFAPMMLVGCKGNTWNKPSEASTQEQYVVEWFNDDGSLLASERYFEGEIPSYKGVTPTKESDYKYNYEFKKWSPEIVNVTRDAQYFATYAKEKRTYNVTWIYNDIVVTERYFGGEWPDYKYPTDPIETPSEFLVFEGWSPYVSEVREDITYTAQFGHDRKQFKIDWVDMYDNWLDTHTYYYGETPAYTAMVPDIIEEQYLYQFKDWTPEIVPVTENAVYKATYTRIERTFTVTWCNEDGSVLEVDEDVPYGTMAEFNSYDLLVAPAGSHPGHSYTLMTGWTSNNGTRDWIDPITSDTVFMAHFDYFVRVHFAVDGNDIRTGAYMWGDTPSWNDVNPEKIDPNHEYTYTFIGWDKPFEPVYEETTYNALFEATPLSFTITWLNSDGTVLEVDENVPYGTIPQYDGRLDPPTSSCPGHSYTLLTGWYSDNGTNYWEPIIGNVTFTACFDYFVRVYFFVDGQQICGDSILWGDTPRYSENWPTPTKIDTEPGYEYTFIGWDKPFEPTYEEITFNAVFEAVYVG